MEISKILLLTAVLSGFLVSASDVAQRKKKDVTQTLQIPKELPATAAGDVRRITFHVTPLSSRGLLSSQIRDALKVLARETSGSSILKIRAFVAGSGDLRRVRDLVSESFTERKQPLPALSLVQAGALPMEGAQVVLEAIASGRKEVNPDGLVIVPASPASSDNPLDPVAPLAEKSLNEMKTKLGSTSASDVLRVTCFLSSLDNLAATRKLVETSYARAALDFVQTQRIPTRALAACEAVARAGAAAGPGAVRIAGPKVTLSGTQVSYGYEEPDSRLAFDRLRKSLEAGGVKSSDVVFAHFYAISDALNAQIRKLSPAYFDHAATSLFVMEGLPSMQAGFAVDVIATQ